MSESTFQKSDWVDELTEGIFEHGTLEKKAHFVSVFTYLLNAPGCPELDATSTFALLAIAALECPGEEDEEWATLVGLASYFFKEAVKNGEDDPKRILENLGNA